MTTHELVSYPGRYLHYEKRYMKSTIFVTNTFSASGGILETGAETPIIRYIGLTNSGTSSSAPSNNFYVTACVVWVSEA